MNAGERAKKKRESGPLTEGEMARGFGLLILTAIAAVMVWGLWTLYYGDWIAFGN